VNLSVSPISVFVDMGSTLYKSLAVGIPCGRRGYRGMYVPRSPDCPGKGSLWEKRVIVYSAVPVITKIRKKAGHVKSSAILSLVNRTVHAPTSSG